MSANYYKDLDYDELFKTISPENRPINTMIRVNDKYVYRFQFIRNAEQLYEWTNGYLNQYPNGLFSLHYEPVTTVFDIDIDNDRWFWRYTNKRIALRYIVYRIRSSIHPSINFTIYFSGNRGIHIHLDKQIDIGHFKNYLELKLLGTDEPDDYSLVFICHVLGNMTYRHLKDLILAQLPNIYKDKVYHLVKVYSDDHACGSKLGNHLQVRRLLHFIDENMGFMALKPIYYDIMYPDIDWQIYEKRHCIRMPCSYNENGYDFKHAEPLDNILNKF